MDFQKIELPSNRKFGFFFSFVFLLAYLYCLLNELWIYSYLLGLLCVSFFIVTLVKAELLLPLNKIWMSIGYLIGLVVSPIVLGILFFGLFTPIGAVIKVFGRDELRIKFVQKNSYWKIRDHENISKESFRNQF